MIFVTVGTTNFDSLVRAIDESVFDEEVIIQKAKGEYEPKNYKFFEFSDKFEEICDKADVIISHGGAGTLFELLGKGKRIVAVPNIERDDKHQEDLVKKLATDGYLTWCKDIKKVDECVTLAKSSEFNAYVPPKNEIAKKIKELIKDEKN